MVLGRNGKREFYLFLCVVEMEKEENVTILKFSHFSELILSTIFLHNFLSTNNLINNLPTNFYLHYISSTVSPNFYLYHNPSTISPQILPPPTIINNPINNVPFYMKSRTFLWEFRVRTSRFPPTKIQTTKNICSDNNLEMTTKSVDDFGHLRLVIPPKCLWEQ